jgi:hypothetical protein
MISNVPYPVMPPVGVRSAKGLLGLGVLLIGTSMLIFGRLEYFFPLAVLYVSFGLFRGVLLGLLDRRQTVGRSGWFPGGGRRESDEPMVEQVGEQEEIQPRRRRRRRGKGGGYRGERDFQQGPGKPNNPDQNR